MNGINRLRLINAFTEICSNLAEPDTVEISYQMGEYYIKVIKWYRNIQWLFSGYIDDDTDMYYLKVFTRESVMEEWGTVKRTLTIPYDELLVSIVDIMCGKK